MGTNEINQWKNARRLNTQELLQLKQREIVSEIPPWVLGLSLMNSVIVAVAYLYIYFVVEPVATCDVGETWKTWYLVSGITAVVECLFSACTYGLVYAEQGASMGLACGLCCHCLVLVFMIGWGLYGLYLYCETHWDDSKSPCPAMTKYLPYIWLYAVISYIVVSVLKGCRCSSPAEEDDDDDDEEKSHSSED